MARADYFGRPTEKPKVRYVRKEIIFPEAWEPIIVAFMKEHGIKSYKDLTMRALELLLKNFDLLKDI